MHLSFEQLQIIRNQRDVLGFPLLPEKVISNALWMAMELRQRVVNAKKSDMELGIGELANADDSEDEDDDDDGLLESPISITADTPKTPIEMSEKAAGKRAVTDMDESPNEDHTMLSDSWDGNGKARKFWIPSVDATYILGGDLEPVVTSSGASAPRSRHIARISASLDPQDAQWATDFASAAQDRPETPIGNMQPQISLESADSGAPPPPASPPPCVAYSHYPPFRFAAEFPAPRLLKDHKRVYSHTVWYAGSLWNLYLQKKETAKHTQLGVYLHRERCPADGSGIGGGGGLGPDDPSLAGVPVDERIGHLERELYTRHHPHQPRIRPRGVTDAGTSRGGRTYDLVPHDPSVDGTTLVGNGQGGGNGSMQDLDTLSGVLRHQAAGSSSSAAAGNDGAGSSRIPKSPDRDLALDRRYSAPLSVLGRNPNEDDEGWTLTGGSGGGRNDGHDRRNNAGRRIHVPALPAYVDRRASIRTYFKIYTPSKGGRVLSVYESTPDESFPFGQSFGWKSKDLVLDDGFGQGIGAEGEEGRRAKEPRLRFMVVLGKFRDRSFGLELLPRCALLTCFPGNI